MKNNNVSQIAVFGLGKLGASMVGVFAECGFLVNGYDIDPKKTTLLREGKAPSYETGLDNLILKNSKNIKAYTVADGILEGTSISFIIVPTPSRNDGTFETNYAESVAKTIGQQIKNIDHYHVVVLTSTVLPGDSRSSIINTLEKFSGKKCGENFGFCYSPEFIALGSVIKDLKNPDYFLIGEFDKNSGDILEYVNRSVAANNPPICRMTIEEAELAKIATNAHITEKISFANYLSALCSRIPGASIDSVTNAIGSDSRVGKKYLKGGMSYGGPCFPRDNRALSAFAKSVDIISSVAGEIDIFNKNYAKWLIDEIMSKINGSKKVGIVGLSYKPDSHLLEESPSILMLEHLKKYTSEIYGYDRLCNQFQLESNSKDMDFLNGIKLTSSLKQIVESCEVLILAHDDEKIASELLEELKNKKSSLEIFDCWRSLKKNIPNNCIIHTVGENSFKLFPLQIGKY